jgi:hypothetical protein
VACYRENLYLTWRTREPVSDNIVTFRKVLNFLEVREEHEKHARYFEIIISKNEDKIATVIK